MFRRTTDVPFGRKKEELSQFFLPSCVVVAAVLTKACVPAMIIKAIWGGAGFDQDDYLSANEHFSRSLAAHQTASLACVCLSVCLSCGTQIDSHVAGHRLPVVFCFREGGRLVQVNEIGMGMPGDDQVKGDCHLAMSLVSLGGFVASVGRATVFRHPRTRPSLDCVPLAREAVDIVWLEGGMMPLPACRVCAMGIGLGVVE